jgi:hypothetical protein
MLSASDTEKMLTQERKPASFFIATNHYSFFIWFVRLMALRPLLAYCASDSEDDCGEADGM